MTECNVCVETYNISTKKKICCIYCEFECCKSCFKQYICSPESYLKCMNPECKETFNRSTLFKYLGITFMNTTYKQIREDILYQREVQYFPATQALIETEVKIEELKEKMNELPQKYDKIKTKCLQELVNFSKNTSLKPVNETITKYMHIKLKYENSDSIELEERRRIKSQIHELNNSSTELTVKAYDINCPHADCKGQLSNTHLSDLENYKCILCKNITCIKCREQIYTNESEHVCDKQTIETIKFIKKTSKPCPNCGIQIHKIHGCFHGNTLIQSYNGSIKLVKELAEGDTLIGDDGTKRTILKTFNGIDTMYRVSQSNAISYIVNSAHKLCLISKSFQKIDISVFEYLKLSEETKSLLYGYKFVKGNALPELSSVTIENVGIGKYYGFTIDGNNKFKHLDGTCLSNCNGMFCCNCHIQFDWVTLRITKERAHNPHHLEYLRTHGMLNRDPLDIRCGQELHVDIILEIDEFVQLKLRQLKHQNIINSNTVNEYKAKLDLFVEQGRMNIHHHQITIPNYQTGQQIILLNSSLRLKLLRGIITEEKFKSEIQKIDKRISKKQEISDILVTYRDCSSEIFFRFHKQVRETQMELEDFDIYFDELVALSNYINQCLAQNARVYACSQQYINTL